MSFLWYCLIAKENKPKQGDILFTFMIITYTVNLIHTIGKIIRAPPTSCEISTLTQNRQEVVLI